MAVRGELSDDGWGVAWDEECWDDVVCGWLDLINHRKHKRHKSDGGKGVRE